MAITKPSLLPELYLPSRVNQHWLESGMDSLELCRDREHYLSYPHKVEYHYNSRGFRDAEWPDDLADVIWCIGDSFTVGLGSPVEHTWPYILQQRTGHRTINVSMDGASNNWISRIGTAILLEFPDASIVTHWSFQQRREAAVKEILENRFPIFYSSVRGPSWPECNKLEDLNKLPAGIQEEITQMHRWPHKIYSEERLKHYDIFSSNTDDVINTQKCMEQLHGNIIHSAVPNWAHLDNIDNFSDVILTAQLDYARDGFHYDILTSNSLVDKIIPALALCATS
jgi:hypothetical protein